MTDKKKLDEQAILNVSTNQDGMTGDTTFVADDALALARLLKTAGVNSAMFNGPASLSVEKNEGNSSITSRINAPDLRSIMNLLEPEFQDTSDAGEDPEMAQKRAQAHSDIDHAFNNSDVAGAELYDPGMDPYGEVPGAPVLDTGANSQFSVAEPQHSSDNVDLEPSLADNTLEVEIDDLGELEGEVVEDADYDYRTHDVHPEEYAGRGDREIIQPNTKMVPARSGDDPIVEAVGGDHQFSTTLDLADGSELEVQVWYEYDSGDFDTGLEYPKTASMGGSLTITSVVGDGQELLDDLGSEDLDRLEQYAYDDLDAASSQDPMESTAPKGFKDYVREAELNELSRGKVVNYVRKVNQDDHEDASKLTLQKRGRGLNMAQSKIHWKDAKVPTREDTAESLAHEFKDQDLNEYGRDDYDRKRRQFGPAFYLNTDCGFASLNDLGTHDYFQGGGVVILEIDRNGRKGLNYVAGHDNTKPGTSVTVITATSTGQKYRPGKVIDSFTFDEYEHDRPGLEKRLAQYGITPTKKLSVKTFD